MLGTGVYRRETKCSSIYKYNEIKGVKKKRAFAANEGSPRPKVYVALVTEGNGGKL